MNTTYYNIGEVSKMFDLPISTLHYYDREGLFPNLNRSKSGVRKFDDSAVESLRLIECLKNSLYGANRGLPPTKSVERCSTNNVKTLRLK